MLLVQMRRRVLEKSTLAPVISVIMPLYNKQATVLSSIGSVLAQSTSDWELIVVDDGSTDTGPDIVRSLEDPRIVLVSQINKGVACARNYGIEHAKSDIVTFLDADDRWSPGYLEAIVALTVQFPEASWFATSYEVSDDLGNCRSTIMRGSEPGFTRGIVAEYFRVAVQSEPPVVSSAVAAIRCAIVSVGGFPNGVRSGEDLLTWARLAVQYSLAYDSRAMVVIQQSGIERSPDPQELVGRALSEMAVQYPATAGLRKYVGLWYRMQAVMAMRFEQKALARRLSRRALWYDPASLRNLYTFAMSFLSRVLRERVDRAFRRMMGRP